MQATFKSAHWLNLSAQSGKLLPIDGAQSAAACCMVPTPSKAQTLNSFMVFWTKSSPTNTLDSSLEPLENAQGALTQARRRLLGGVIVLILACALIPWMLDNTPRRWGEDVILRMPKNEQPYQAKPSKSAVAPQPAGAKP